MAIIEGSVVLVTGANGGLGIEFVTTSIETMYPQLSRV